MTSPVLSDGSASFTPSGENRAGVKTAYHGGLKSFDTQTNSSQAVVGQRLTDAFGNQISSSGVWKGRFAYGGPYGYQEDPDTGLRLLGHRYYDSSTGRFLTRDPIEDGRNWYSYCGNRPVMGYDPDGLAYLLFDGTSLSLVSDDGTGNPRIVLSVPAFSGAPGSQAIDQDTGDYGPIPEGSYSVDPMQMQEWNPASAIIGGGIAPNGFPGGSFNGNPDDWGHFRVPIGKKKGNKTKRHSFYIHSGKWVGSIGCIDVPEAYLLLMYAMILLVHGEGPITLVVDYSGTNTGSGKKPLRKPWVGSVPSAPGTGKGPTWEDYLKDRGKAGSRG